MWEEGKKEKWLYVNLSIKTNCLVMEVWTQLRPVLHIKWNFLFLDFTTVIY